MPRGGSVKYSEAKLRAKAIARIERMSIPEPNSGCWLWTGCIDHRGYGKTGFGVGRTLPASRLSYLVHCDDPGALNVLHRCDERSCVNPAHLWAGTQQENIIDCFRKGRARPRGTAAVLKQS